MTFVFQFFWFGVAGIAGFLVDAGVLYLLTPLMGLYWARLASFVCAIMATWLFNRTITFRRCRSGHSVLKELGIYVGLMLAGGLVNYFIYAWLVYSYAWVAAQPVIGVAAGSLAGMLINLCTSRFMLFRIETR